MKIKKIAFIFIIIYVVLCILFYVISTLAPIIACLATILYVACTSGNTFLITVSVLITLFFVALIASPIVHDYLELKKKSREDSDS